MLGDITKRVDTGEFDEFVALPENSDRNFELVDGEIVEKMVSGPVSSRLGLRMGRFIDAFVDAYDLGQVSGADGGYWVGDDRYIPDVAYISKAKLIHVAKYGYVMTTPDLAVEVISPTDEKNNISTKIVNYLAAGTVLWLVDPKDQSVKVCEPNKPMVRFTRNMTLKGGRVLPNFTLDLELLFKIMDEPIIE